MPSKTHLLTYDTDAPVTAPRTMIVVGGGVSREYAHDGDLGVEVTLVEGPAGARVLARRSPRRYSTHRQSGHAAAGEGARIEELSLARRRARRDGRCRGGVRRDADGRHLRRRRARGRRGLTPRGPAPGPPPASSRRRHPRALPRQCRGPRSGKTLRAQRMLRRGARQHRRLALGRPASGDDRERLRSQKTRPSPAQSPSRDVIGFPAFDSTAGQGAFAVCPNGCVSQCRNFPIRVYAVPRSHGGKTETSSPTPNPYEAACPVQGTGRGSLGDETGMLQAAHHRTAPHTRVTPRNGATERSTRPGRPGAGGPWTTSSKSLQLPTWPRPTSAALNGLISRHI